MVENGNSCLRQRRQKKAQLKILEFIEKNQNLVFETIDFIVHNYLDKRDEFSGSSSDWILEYKDEFTKNVIINAIKQNLKLVHVIASGFANACFYSNEGKNFAKAVIPEIIKQNPSLVCEFIKSFATIYLNGNAEDFAKEIILKVIEEIITKNVYNNEYMVSEIIRGFTDACLSFEKKEDIVEDMVLKTLELCLYNEQFQQHNLTKFSKNNIINGFTRAYILSNKDIDFIQTQMFKIIEKRNNLVNTIIDGFVSACVSSNNVNFVQANILEIIKKRQDLAPKVIDSFMNNCFLSKKIDLLKAVIPIIINQEQNVDLVFNIVNRLLVNYECNENDNFDIGELVKQAINKNQDLARIYNIFQNFTTNILTTEEISKIATLLDEVAKTNNQKLNDIIKLSSIVVLFQYLQEILFTLNHNEDFINVERDHKREEEILKLLKKCGVVDPTVEKFDDIQIDSLVVKWAELYGNKIQYKGIDCGSFMEVLPYAFKDFAKGQTVGYLFDNKTLKNFYFIRTHNQSGQDQFEFLRKKSKETGDVYVAYLSTKNHGLISIIKNGREKFIDSSYGGIDALVSLIKNGCEKFIDSSRDSISKAIMDDVLNFSAYQENGTCYINAEIAFKMILDNYSQIAQENGFEDIIFFDDRPFGKDMTDEEGFEHMNNGRKIVSKISRETVKLYEFLGSVESSRFAVAGENEFVEPHASAPMTQMVDQLAQQFQNNIEVNQQVQQLKIAYKNFIIDAEHLTKALKELNYKVQCFDKRNHEIKDTESIDEFVCKGVWNPDEEQYTLDRIIATKVGQHTQQRPRVIFDEGSPEMVKSILEKFAKQRTQRNSVDSSKSEESSSSISLD